MIPLLLVFALSYIDCGPIDIKISRIVIFDHLDDQTFVPMYRELVCFNDDDYVIGSVVVKPDAFPVKEYIFTERFTRKRWRLRFHHQEYLGCEIASRKMFPKQAEIRFLLKERLWVNTQKD